MVHGGKKYETKMKSLDLKEVNLLWERIQSHMKAYYNIYTLNECKASNNSVPGEVPFPFQNEY